MAVTTLFFLVGLYWALAAVAFGSLLAAIYWEYRDMDRSYIAASGAFAATAYASLLAGQVSCALICITIALVLPAFRAWEVRGEGWASRDSFLELFGTGLPDIGVLIGGVLRMQRRLRHDEKFGQ